MSVKQLIENYYQSFNTKNYEQMLGLLAENVVHDINQGDRMTGKDKFKEFLKSMDYHYSENLKNIVICTDESAGRASAEFICSGIYQKTAEGLPVAKGQKYELPVGCFFEVKNQKITRVTNYYNLNDWIKMVS